MENNIAYLIKKTGELKEENPGKKFMQKIAYLIQAKGINLGLEYGMHFYGPYSAELDFCVVSLVAEGVAEFDYKGFSHLVGIVEGHDPECSFDDSALEIIEEVINRHKKDSPGDLELLTTTHYVKKNFKIGSDDDIIKGVIKIKGSKYTTEKITSAIKNLEQYTI